MLSPTLQLSMAMTHGLRHIMTSATRICHRLIPKIFQEKNCLLTVTSEKKWFPYNGPLKKLHASSQNWYLPPPPREILNGSSLNKYALILPRLKPSTTDEPLTFEKNIKTKEHQMFKFSCPVCDGPPGTRTARLD